MKGGTDWWYFFRNSMYFLNVKDTIRAKGPSLSYSSFVTRLFRFMTVWFHETFFCMALLLKKNLSFFTRYFRCSILSFSRNFRYFHFRLLSLWDTVLLLYDNIVTRLSLHDSFVTRFFRYTILSLHDTLVGSSPCFKPV
jgi:hypothetical protein